MAIVNVSMKDVLYEKIKAHCRDTAKMPVATWLRFMMERELVEAADANERLRQKIAEQLPAEQAKNKAETEAYERAEEERRIKREEQKAAATGN
jgi:hypothetical protein